MRVGVAPSRDWPVRAGLWPGAQLELWAAASDLLPVSRSAAEWPSSQHGGQVLRASVLRE